MTDSEYDEECYVFFCYYQKQAETWIKL